MSKTMAEKILARHTENGRADAGEIVQASVDFIMVHEVLGSRIIDILQEMETDSVWDPNRIMVVNDHWAPAPNIQSAIIHQRNREFVKRHGIKYFCDVNCGVSHQVLIEWGLAKPGDLIIGSDSHTTSYGAMNAFSTGLAATDSAIVLATGKNWFKVPESMRINIDGELAEMVMSKDLILKIIADLGPDGANYKAIEFHGPVVDKMTVASRATMCNMSVEAGAKAGLMTVNKQVEDWLSLRAREAHWTRVDPDPTAEYVEMITYDLDTDPVEPMIATPHSPANGRPVTEVDVEIDQAFLGSCTNGRFEDLQIAAMIMKGHKVKEGVRFIITPASMETYKAALNMGFIETFIQAGAIVTNPTCGACVGGHLGILGPNEVAITSTNRNFRGRMGHPDSRIYLSSPATVAASAIMGRITDPRGF